MTTFGGERSVTMVARFILAMMLFVAIAPRLAEAQSKDKVYRLGFLASGTATASAGMVENLRDGLRERGWVEGRNVDIDYRFAEGNFDRLPNLAAELIGKKVDIIVAAPSPAVVAAKRATDSIPIVMANVADPVGSGLVASLARPGGNITGLSYSFGWDVWGKQLQILNEAIPSARRVAILSNPANAGHPRAVDNIKGVARTLGVSLQLLEARAPAEFDDAFAAMTKGRAQALLVVSDSLFGSHADRLAELAVKHRLPTIHGARSNVDAGGLIFYGPNLVNQLRQAAVYVDKILKGANPADLPIEQPTKFDLVINLKAAKSLGVTIPPSLLVRADQVIE